MTRSNSLLTSKAFAKVEPPKLPNMDYKLLYGNEAVISLYPADLPKSPIGNSSSSLEKKSAADKENKEEDRKKLTEVRKPFVKQFHTLIKQFKEWKLSDDTAKQQLDLLDNKLFEEGYAINQPSLYFESIKFNLETLYFILTPEPNNIPQAKRLSFYKDLVMSLGVCSPGLHSHIETSIEHFLIGESVESWLARLRTDLIDNYAKEYHLKARLRVGDQVHTVKAFMLHAAEHNLNPMRDTKTIDTFITKSITQEDFNKFLDIIHNEYNIETIIDTFVKNILSILNDKILENVKEDNKGWIEIQKYHHFATSIENRLNALFKLEPNTILLLHLISVNYDIDTNKTRIKLNINKNLIFQHFISYALKHEIIDKKVYAKDAFKHGIINKDTYIKQTLTRKDEKASTDTINQCFMLSAFFPYSDLLSQQWEYLADKDLKFMVEYALNKHAIYLASLNKLAIILDWKMIHEEALQFKKLILNLFQHTDNTGKIETLKYLIEHILSPNLTSHDEKSINLIDLRKYLVDGKSEWLKLKRNFSGEIATQLNGIEIPSRSFFILNFLEAYYSKRTINDESIKRHYVSTAKDAYSLHYPAWGKLTDDEAVFLVAYLLSKENGFSHIFDDGHSTYSDLIKFCITKDFSKTFKFIHTLTHNPNNQNFDYFYSYLEYICAHNAIKILKMMIENPKFYKVNIYPKTKPTKEAKEDQNSISNISFFSNIISNLQLKVDPQAIATKDIDTVQRALSKAIDNNHDQIIILLESIGLITVLYTHRNHDRILNSHLNKIKSNNPNIDNINAIQALINHTNLKILNKPDVIDAILNTQNKHLISALKNKKIEYFVFDNYYKSLVALQHNFEIKVPTDQANIRVYFTELICMIRHLYTQSSNEYQSPYNLYRSLRKNPLLYKAPMKATQALLASDKQVANHFLFSDISEYNSPLCLANMPLEKIPFEDLSRLKFLYFLILNPDFNKIINKPDNNGNTLLHNLISCSTEALTIAELCDAGADPNIKNQTGDTSLHVAIKSNHILAFMRLFQSGKADPLIKNNDGKTVHDFIYTGINSIVSNTHIPMLSRGYYLPISTTALDDVLELIRNEFLVNYLNNLTPHSRERHEAYNPWIYRDFYAVESNLRIPTKVLLDLYAQFNPDTIINYIISYITSKSSNDIGFLDKTKFEKMLDQLKFTMDIEKCFIMSEKGTLTLNRNYIYNKLLFILYKENIFNSKYILSNSKLLNEQKQKQIYLLDLYFPLNIETYNNWLRLPLENAIELFEYHLKNNQLNQNSDEEFWSVKNRKILETMWQNNEKKADQIDKWISQANKEGNDKVLNYLITNAPSKYNYKLIVLETDSKPSNQNKNDDKKTASQHLSISSTVDTKQHSLTATSNLTTNSTESNISKSRSLFIENFYYKDHPEHKDHWKALTEKQIIALISHFYLLSLKSDSSLYNSAIRAGMYICAADNRLTAFNYYVHLTNPSPEDFKDIISRPNNSITKYIITHYLHDLHSVIDVLSWAVDTNNTSNIKLLIEKFKALTSASQDSKHDAVKTILTKAILANKAGTVDILLSYGIKPNHPETYINELLADEKKLPTLKTLLKNNLIKPTDFPNTVLPTTRAITYENPGALEALIQAGQTSSQDRHSLLWQAYQASDKKYLLILLKHKIDIDTNSFPMEKEFDDKSIERQSPVKYALKYDSSFLKQLIAAGADTKSLLNAEACQKPEYKNEFYSLIEAGIDLTLTDDKGNTLLHNLLLKGSSGIFHENVVLIALSNNMFNKIVNIQNKNGETISLLAAKRGYFDVIDKILLKNTLAGQVMDFSLRDNEGKNILDLAKQNTQLAHLLLQRGALIDLGKIDKQIVQQIIRGGTLFNAFNSLVITLHKILDNNNNYNYNSSIINTFFTELNMHIDITKFYSNDKVLNIAYLYSAFLNYLVDLNIFNKFRLTLINSDLFEKNILILEHGIYVIPEYFPPNIKNNWKLLDDAPLFCLLEYLETHLEFQHDNTISLNEPKNNIQTNFDKKNTFSQLTTTEIAYDIKNSPTDTKKDTKSVSNCTFNTTDDKDNLIEFYETLCIDAAKNNKLKSFEFLIKKIDFNVILKLLANDRDYANDQLCKMLTLFTSTSLIKNSQQLIQLLSIVLSKNEILDFERKSCFTCFEIILNHPLAIFNYPYDKDYVALMKQINNSGKHHLFDAFTPKNDPRAVTLAAIDKLILPEDSTSRLQISAIINNYNDINNPKYDGSNLLSDLKNRHEYFEKVDSISRQYPIDMWLIRETLFSTQKNDIPNQTAFFDTQLIPKSNIKVDSDVKDKRAISSTTFFDTKHQPTNNPNANLDSIASPTHSNLKTPLHNDIKSLITAHTQLTARFDALIIDINSQIIPIKTYAESFAILPTSVAKKHIAEQLCQDLINFSKNINDLSLTTRMSAISTLTKNVNGYISVDDKFNSYDTLSTRLFIINKMIKHNKVWDRWIEFKRAAEPFILPPAQQIDKKSNNKGLKT